MILITNQEDFLKAGYKDLIELECECCHVIFSRQKRQIKSSIHNNNGQKYCSKQCQSKKQEKGKSCHCKKCGKLVYRRLSEINKNKAQFCSSSCVASFYKKHGSFHPTQRSKLEKWLEIKLVSIYPELKIEFNNRIAINSELDIYFPSLGLAIELNGVFHYEPIFGTEKLKIVQNNDKRKFAACNENGISLCVIDTSKIKYIKKSTCGPILEIILNLIKEKLSNRF